MEGLFYSYSTDGSFLEADWQSPAGFFGPVKMLKCQSNKDNDGSDRENGCSRKLIKWNSRFAGNGKVQKEKKVERDLVNLSTKNDASVHSLPVLPQEWCRLLTSIDSFIFVEDEQRAQLPLWFMKTLGRVSSFAWVLILKISFRQSY